MANVLGEFLGSVASAIRDMTGDLPEVKMKPADFPDKIRSINTGVDVSGVTATAEDVKAGKVFVDAAGNEIVGTLIPEIVDVTVSDEIWAGSNTSNSLVGSGIIRYVTFMNHDGTVEYGKKSVIKGENCVDPVENGHLDTPTRESSAMYDYTFLGWATEPNGGVNADALKAVTEDRTVYANFASAIRYYTITFYDSDGATVLTTKSVAYGAIPEYTPPSKTGYTFVGWDKPLVAVTGATSYIAQWTASAAIKAVSKIESTPSFGEMVIANNGDRLFLSRPKSTNSINVYYYYSVKTKPTRIDSPLSTYLNAYGMALCYDDVTLSLIGTNQTGSVYYLAHRQFASGGATSHETLSMASTTGNLKLVYSPFSSMWAYSTYTSGKHTIALSTGRSISTGGKMKAMAICKNDEYIVYAGENSGVVVYRISDGSQVATLSTISNVNNIAVSADGLKVVVSFSTSPYVAVYSMETLTEICRLNTYITASSHAAFVGDLVVVATGSKVRAFDIEGSTPTEYFGIPTYSGGSVSKIAASHNCNNLALYDGTNITVWAKA